MDTSESDHSNMDSSDDEWVQSTKKLMRRKASRARGSLGTHQPESNNSENTKECSDEFTEKIDGLCCSCSKNTLCKTTKCRCRANGNSCGQSCGCSLLKCSNRDAETNTTSNDVAGNEEMNLVAHGAMLLQNALESEKAAETNEDGTATRRKALTDIGNTLVILIIWINLTRDYEHPLTPKKIKKTAYLSKSFFLSRNLRRIFSKIYCFRVS